MRSALDAAARVARTDPDAAISSLDWLGPSLDADAAAGRFRAWGRSSIIDENTGSAVIPRALFDALHARIGSWATWPVGNAGLLHVYGYLLSDAPTPYGLKRERWLDGTLAHAYGLPSDAFLPRLGHPTPLARITRAARDLLASSVVRTHDLANGSAHLRARLALGRAGSSGSFALAYDIADDDGEHLVTTFPVANPELLLAAMDDEPPRLRYNAAL
ncbi:MAG: amino acid deaminase [Actinobacteria bacterium]|nr:amino acid deaminase [Actinomycetota bacterium]